MPYALRRLDQPVGAFPLAFRRAPLGTVLALAREGDGVSVSNFAGCLFFANHPDLVREVLIERNDAFVKARGLQLARYLLGEGLLTSEPPHHTRVRKLVLPALHHARLRQYGDAMGRRAAEAADGWTDGAVLDGHRAMMALTLEIAGETLFGANVEREVEAVGRAMHDVMSVFDRITNPFARLLHYLPAPATLRFRRAIRTLDRIVYGFIAARRASGEDRGDLLSMLLAAQDEETGAGLTDREVRDEALTLLLAGHETTAVALSWTLRLLALHPEAQDRLHAEVDAALGDAPATFDDLQRLPYTRQVFSEGMRLYPPGWLVGRQATRGVTIGGEPLRAGTTVLFSPYTIHRDARWWEEPEAFRPERFTAEAKRARPKFAYLPFSAGQRGCIGEPFAWAEGTLVLATVARRWRLHAEAPEPGLFPSITLRPAGPVRLRVERRPGRALPARAA
jgi:cytochrome P450